MKPAAPTPAAPATTSLLHEAALTSQLPDVRVQIVFYMFAAHMLFCMTAMVLGGIPYYHYFGALDTHHGLWASVGAVFISHALMTAAITHRYVHVAIGAGASFTLAWAFFVGFFCATIYNIAPIQCMAMWWGQAMAMVIYTRLSPRLISVNKAGAVMTVATLLVWSASIYGFIVEVDWWGAAIILCLSLAMVGYNMTQIEDTENRYDASWEQGVTAVCNYYGCDAVARTIRCLAN